jgi:RimJ/RimL family protein N-acetyltransferase
VQTQLLQRNDRVLFFVSDSNGNKVGHVGLFRFNYEEGFCEIDNIVRGSDQWKGAIEAGCSAMMTWAFETLGLNRLYLRVVSDNERAIRLYERLGFTEVQRVPLRKVTAGDTTSWVEVVARPYEKIQRYFVSMELRKEQWSGGRRA